MAPDFKAYLDSINFERWLKKLKKKIKDRSVIIYGAGSLFQYVKDNYDISDINIIGISDLKFTEESGTCMGYPIVVKDNIAEHKPDFVVLATQNYSNLLETFVLEDFKGTKIKVLPLARKSIMMLLKEIWA